MFCTSLLKVMQKCNDLVRSVMVKDGSKASNVEKDRIRDVSKWKGHDSRGAAANNSSASKCL